MAAQTSWRIIGCIIEAKGWNKYKLPRTEAENAAAKARTQKK